MITNRQLDDLVALLRRRYPDWEDCLHPGFVRDETAPKRATAEKARSWLSEQTLDDLIARAAHDEILTQLDRLANDNNLLWRRVPSAGDTAVLAHPDLDKAGFCTQVRNLLHGDSTGPDRLQSFSSYLAANGLPNGWPLPTYLLALMHPGTELFVKPRTAHWFLQFMGETGAVVTAPPDAATYRLLLSHAAALRTALADYGAVDLVDVQSFIWVAHCEGRARTGRLDARGQIDLDVPPAEPLDLLPQPAAVREPSPAYDAGAADPPPTRQDLARRTGHSPAEIDSWLSAIARKGQAVLYGPPGTGKTFIAGLLARHLAGGDGGEAGGLVEMIQFHPAYAYEDFIQGIRPVVEDGQVRYEMQNGRLLDFCQRAVHRPGTHVLIIDELNRANISAVFGELMVLLEYRDRAIPLAGGGSFRLPGSVRLLATMNTADRSIALVDHALRRRFAFIRLWPSDDVLRHYHAAHNPDYDVAPLLRVLQQVNAELEPNYQIGHAFFLLPDLPDQMEGVWQTEIEPYLEEYFYGQPERAAPFRWDAVSRQL